MHDPERRGRLRVDAINAHPPEVEINELTNRPFVRKNQMKAVRSTAFNGMRSRKALAICADVAKDGGSHVALLSRAW